MSRFNLQYSFNSACSDHAQQRISNTSIFFYELYSSGVTYICAISRIIIRSAETLGTPSACASCVIPGRWTARLRSSLHHAQSHVLLCSRSWGPLVDVFRSLPIVNDLTNSIELTLALLQFTAALLLYPVMSIQLIRLWDTIWLSCEMSHSFLKVQNRSVSWLLDGSIWWSPQTLIRWLCDVICPTAFCR